MHSSRNKGTNCCDRLKYLHLIYQVEVLTLYLSIKSTSCEGQAKGDTGALQASCEFHTDMLHDCETQKYEKAAKQHRKYLDPELL